MTVREGPEQQLRDIWSRQGVPEHEQDRMIAEIEHKASATYLSNMFKLAEIREGKKS